MSALDIYLAAVFLVGIWAVVPLFWMLIRKELPSKKVYALITTLQEADDVFHFAAEGGLLDVTTAMDFHARLAVLHERAHSLRLRAFQAMTSWQDLMNMRRGLSHELARLIRDVKVVRARISAARASYVEIQNVQLRTVDGKEKEVAQLRYEVTTESGPLLASPPVSDSALFAIAARDVFGNPIKMDEKAAVAVV